MRFSVLLPNIDEDNNIQITLAKTRNYKEICHRFIQVFGHQCHLQSICVKCLSYHHFKCSYCVNLPEYDELIVFDFGSRTTWFKYTNSSGTGQLSMHPTTLPICSTGQEYDGRYCPNAYESCPVCTRSLHRHVTPVADCSSTHESKRLSKFERFRVLDCFGTTCDDGHRSDDGLVHSSAPPSCAANVSPESSPPGCVTMDDDVAIYSFLIRHMLKRNPFFHVEDIPFVICEPVFCCSEMKRRLTELLICQLKVPM